MYRWIISALICAGAVVLYPQRAYVQAQGMPVRPGLITARLESNKSIYHAGEPIMLRLTLISRIADEIDVVNDAPYDMSHLEVLDAEGKVLSPTVARGPCWCQGSVRTAQLFRGTPLVVAYNDPRVNEREGAGYVAGGVRTWTDVKDWGYVLEQPGRYTLVASLGNVTAIIPGGAEFSASSSDKSNAVHIKIVK